ncbi:hypothetical protein [uncultured Chitinophaga sp.]|uniref:hypothetical protein n=1 Tax=uncultured Chitinophaga sp. TaxID=339340 RepID=UPI0025F05D20|nr:hypothetical protein [uncultured Chitinophaga sp.]
MKILLIYITLTVIFRISLYAQASGSLVVQGDLDKFYPVTFLDAGRPENIPTDLAIGRSNVHLDDWWRGSIISTFRFHASGWGNQSAFIDANIRYYATTPLIADWQDISIDNGSTRICIWMRGSTTYFYKASGAVDVLVYDGVQNALPLILPNNSTMGPVNYRMDVDPQVNGFGATNEHTVFYTGPGLNFLAGSLGIGTLKTNGHRLAVEGSIGARKIKVDQTTWADYVFAPDYQLRSIPEVEAFIKTHNHLPDIPSADEVAKEGIDVGEMNKKLLQKVEELTLYLIEEHKKVAVLQDEVAELKTKVNTGRKP